MSKYRYLGDNMDNGKDGKRGKHENRYGVDIFSGLGTTRRTFLKGLALTATAAGLGGTISGCGGYHEMPEGLKFLDEKGYAVISAFADRIIPRGGPYEIGALDAGVVEFFDEFAATDYPEVQKDFKSVITLLEHGAPVLDFKFKRFTQMNDDEKDEYLRGWESSKLALLRGAFVGLKKLCFMGFYTNEKVWPHIGYDGPWV